jgi:hypothetical protein
VLGGNFFSCSSSLKWTFVQKQTFPKFIPAPIPTSVRECPAIKSINSAISNTNYATRSFNALLNQELIIQSNENNFTLAQKNDPNYVNYKRNIEANLVKVLARWKLLHAQTSDLMKNSTKSCIKYEKELLPINTSVAIKLGINI